MSDLYHRWTNLTNISSKVKALKRIILKLKQSTSCYDIRGKHYN